MKGTECARPLPAAVAASRARCGAMLGLLILTSVLAGCAVGPDFQPPEPPASSRYTAENQPSRTVSALSAFGASQQIVPGLSLDGQWWHGFGSARLDDLVEQALRASPTLDAARAKLREARETYAARAGDTLYPQVEAGAGAERQKLNQAAQGLSGDSREFSLYDAGISVHYTLDLAGGNRRALEALAARTNYRSHELAAAQLSLAGNIVSTAFARAGLADQILVMEARARDLDARVDLAREQLRVGQASPDAVHVLQTEAARAWAELPLLHKQLEQQDHLLAVLSGQAPGTARVPDFRLDEFTLPARLPLVLPSELVRQRPDIQSAEALLHAANADYGVAVARLYPQIELGASLGSQALTTGALFGAGSAAWSLLGQLTQPLFKPGLNAEKRASLAALDAAAANYQDVVLQALREVADVLRAVDQDARSLAARATADTESRLYLHSMERQYALGSVSLGDVLQVRQQTWETRADLIDAQVRRLADSSALYLALGGGKMADADDPVADSVHFSRPGCCQLTAERPAGFTSID